MASFSLLSADQYLGHNLIQDITEIDSLELIDYGGGFNQSNFYTKYMPEFRKKRKRKKEIEQTSELGVLIGGIWNKACFTSFEKL